MSRAICRTAAAQAPALVLAAKQTVQRPDARLWSPALSAPHLHRAPGSGGRRDVAAAAKRGGGGSKRKNKGKKPQLDERAQFEQLMCDWDDAFAADCEDSAKAARMAALAEEGYRQHGRGFVFVRSRLERRSRKSGGGGGSGGSAASKGFGAAKAPQEPGKQLPNNPQLYLLEWSACYIPGSQMYGAGGVFSTADGTVLPDSGSLLPGQAGGSSEGGVANSEAGWSGLADAEALDEFRRVMRGMDTTQLHSLVGLTPPGATGSGSDSDSISSSSSSSSLEGEPTAPAAGADSGSAVASADAEAQAAEAAEAAALAAASAQAEALTGGLRQYDPEAGELVVLLSARISGKPSLGAELLVVEEGEDGSICLDLPKGWEGAYAEQATSMGMW